MASVKKRPDGQWRARYRDDAGKEHARHFGRKVDGAAVAGRGRRTAVATGHATSTPQTARTTVGAWCETWLAGYATRRTLDGAAGARAHVALIRRGVRRACRCRRSGRRTCGRGRRGCGEEGLRGQLRLRAARRALRRSSPTRCTTGLVPRSAVLAAQRRRRRASSGPTSPRRSRCGRCTTRCPSSCARRSCSARSPACGSSEVCGLRVVGRRLHARRRPPGCAVPGRAAEDGDVADAPSRSRGRWR